MAGLLVGKLALVTGGGSGIGRAVCSAFGREGARVVVTDIDGAAAKATASTLSGTCTSFSWRTHTCGELTDEHVGNRVTLCGWLQYKRPTKFATIRDGYGATQLYFTEQKTNLAKMMNDLCLESVVEVTGTVANRPPGQESNKMATGKIELHVEDLKVLSQSKPQLPFLPRDFQKVKEALRLQYRYLDLRNATLQENLRVRSSVVMKIREFLCNQHKFIDVETPTLFRRTPGGAQEFVVPTKHKGLYYSLTQSPQQFKQLLMIGGLDRYFQIARCYRDETTRPDRQPEFTQVDIEMSFVTISGICTLVEEMLSFCWPTHLPAVKGPFPRMSYTEAVENYGSDKPDTRFEIKLQNVPECLKSCVPFLNDASGDFCVKAIVIPQFGSCFGRSAENKFREQATNNYGGVGLAFIKVESSRLWSSSLNKYIMDDVRKFTCESYNLQPDDVIILCFGKSQHVYSLLGKLRLDAAELLEKNGVVVRDTDAQKFLWVIDFPLFDRNDAGVFESMHHPFTAPHPDDAHLLYTVPSKVRGQHYDLVLNGAEIGGGSIRIHEPILQRFILHDILKEDVSHLNHLIEALESGCPPHGGIALGLDRLIAIMCNSSSIRDVIAFPKSLEGKDLMANAPAQISDHEKHLYHLK